MKNKTSFIIKTTEILSLIILYFITKNQNFFSYVLTLSLYNIFISFFENMSISDIFKRNEFLSMLLSSGVISILFIIISVLIGKLVGTILNINNILIVFIFMSLNIFTYPASKILFEYLSNTTSNRIMNLFSIIYNIFDRLLLLIIALLSMKVFKLNNNLAISFLYLSKIISLITVYILAIILYKKLFIAGKKTSNKKVNYLEEIKKILTKNNYKSIINIVKKCYYYISIIILYWLLITKYNYGINEVSLDITFVYLYFLSLYEYILYFLKKAIDNNEKTYLENIFDGFSKTLLLAIITTIISPLICKLLFNETNHSVYLIMISYMSIFGLLYDITYGYIKNKTVIYISLISGIITKAILIVPLINSFYRMGYNLIYGDIISTIIGFLISIIINYIYLYNTSKIKINNLMKVLKTLYDGIIFCSILIICQFVIPINTDSYLKSILILIIYVIIIYTIIKIKNVKRG